MSERGSERVTLCVCFRSLCSSAAVYAPGLPRRALAYAPSLALDHGARLPVGPLPTRARAGVFPSFRSRPARRPVARAAREVCAVVVAPPRRWPRPCPPASRRSLSWRSLSWKSLSSTVCILRCCCCWRAATSRCTPTGGRARRRRAPSCRTSSPTSTARTATPCPCPSRSSSRTSSPATSG